MNINRPRWGSFPSWEVCLKAMETAEKMSKGVAAREFCIDPALPRHAVYLQLRRDPRGHKGSKRPGVYSRKYMCAHLRESGAFIRGSTVYIHTCLHICEKVITALKIVQSTLFLGLCHAIIGLGRKVNPIPVTTRINSVRRVLQCIKLLPSFYNSA